MTEGLPKSVTPRKRDPGERSHDVGYHLHREELVSRTVRRENTEVESDSLIKNREVWMSIYTEGDKDQRK